MDNRRNYYRVLHVQPDAPSQIIRASYRTLMQKMRVHPDLGGDGREASLINEAYAVLRDAKARARYDRLLRSAGAQGSLQQTGSGYTAAGKFTARCAFCEQPHDAVVAPEDDCPRCASPLYPADKRRLEQNSQRTVNRISRCHPLTFFAGANKAQPIAGLTQDLSLHGLQFLTNVAPPAGEIISIESAVCRAAARVVSCLPAAQASNSRWQVGVEFVTLRFENPQGTFVTTTA